MISNFFMPPMSPLSAWHISQLQGLPLTYRLALKIAGLTAGLGSSKIPYTNRIDTTAPPVSAVQQNDSGNTQTESSPSGLVNPLGEPLNSSGSGSGSGVSSIKTRSEIIDLRIAKANDGREVAYILAGVDKELQEKYGERVYEHVIYPSAITHLERVGRSKWGFHSVKKLPRWRQILRTVAGFITLAGGTYLLTSVVGPFFALAISAAGAIGVRKLLTLDRSVKFTAETAELNLTDGFVPKRDYDILQRLVREAANCPQSGEAPAYSGAY